jgi:hypothetical protein
MTVPVDPGVASSRQRAFGRIPRDLEIPLRGMDRLMAVTELLACCCDQGEMSMQARREAAWGLTVSQRVFQLLRIVELTQGGGDLQVILRCLAKECGEEFQVELAFADFASLMKGQGGRQEVRVPLGGDREFELRLPTGRDQESWRKSQFEDRADAAKAIVQSLAKAPGNLPERWSPEELAVIQAAMDDADPMVAFTVHAGCPACGMEATFPVDLEAVALRILQRFRTGILRDVHDLAVGYGWTEAEVLAIRPERRAEYKRLIEVERGELR